MKKTKNRFIILLGILCIIFTGVSSWYTIVFNDSRFIVPMDLSGYTFRAKDIPMIISGIFIFMYVLYLIVLFIQVVSANKYKEVSSQLTRKINPKLGLLGLFGFTGFIGFWTYSIDKTIFPFGFFIFFGFFGFFYEGKLSGTFMDERYKENKMKAHFQANKITLTIIFIATIILGQGRLIGNLEYTFIAYIIIVSIALALELFLSGFLLYHYDNDLQIDESEE